MDADHLSNLSHDELIKTTQTTLGSLLSTDSLLNDLPKDIITEEILSQIAVETGQSITVYICRNPEPTLKVIIPQDATVADLKKATARHFEIYQKRTGIKDKISWKYIWKTYYLAYDTLNLDNDTQSILDYGVCNKVILTFKKRRKIK